MIPTPAELNRATLARQHLLHREPLGVTAAARHLLALQGQHPASPYLALWNRLEHLDPADVDAALATGALVKATLLRVTLHVVHAADHTMLRTALRTTLRDSRFTDARFLASGLSVAEADALVPPLLDHLTTPRTSSEVEAWLRPRVPGSAEGAWWALRSIAPLVHAPNGGAWSFGPRPRFAAPPAPGPGGDRLADDGLSDDGRPDDGLLDLVPRYLAAYGPATVADVGVFTRVHRTRIRTAVERLVASGAVRADDGTAGPALLDVPGGARPAGDTPAPPRLLGMWDAVLLAYADRSRVIPPEYRRLVIRANGDVLPTLLVDGHVAGVWRPVSGGLEATAFRPLTDTTWDGLAAEARSLLALLADREPAVYSRYGHWWASLPAGQVRVLPAR